MLTIFWSSSILQPIRYHSKQRDYKKKNGLMQAADAAAHGEEGWDECGREQGATRQDFQSRNLGFTSHQL